jgi:hypothetical protein
MGCTVQKPRQPTGVLEPESRYIELSEKYRGEIDARQDEIEIQIKLLKTQFASEETITVSVSLINRSDHDVVVRKPDSETNRVSNYANRVDEIVFLIVPDDPSVSLDFSLRLLDGPGMLPPETFILLSPSQSYTTSMTVLHPVSPMPEGRYSLSLKYSNYRFDSQSPDKSGPTFLDYHAWMGEITSNVVTFDIVNVISQPR